MEYYITRMICAAIFGRLPHREAERKSLSGRVSARRLLRISLQISGINYSRVGETSRDAMDRAFHSAGTLFFGALDKIRRETCGACAKFRFP